MLDLWPFYILILSSWLSTKIQNYYSWIGRPIRANKRLKFLTNQRGYDKSETTDEKLSARRIQIKQVKAWPQQKCTQQIWIRLTEYSSSKVSGPSEVPRFVFKLFF